MTTPRRLLLGPQRPDIYIQQQMARAGMLQGPIGVISAAWQEAEGDLDELSERIGQPLRDVPVYTTTEGLFEAEPQLHKAYRQRQERLRELQRIYRLRLRQLQIAVRHTLDLDSEPAIAAAERRHAVSQLRALDRHHLRRVAQMHARFDVEVNIDTSPGLAARAQSLARTLDECQTIIITGGNVVVLLNRLRLYGLERLLRRKDIVAWSAGAMMLFERVVLFHDKLPQGRRDPEVVGSGLGMLDGAVLMPDAYRRLRLSDTVRMSALSRRLAPATTLLIENQSALYYEGKRLVTADGARYPNRDGRLKPVLPA